ncbi:hypothetical protein DFH29DRAFT_451544 [Suillus ampliporus]|nr:hypothetical protein DFH29DRAFT_451544 [Suillus ampliporus]
MLYVHEACAQLGCVVYTQLLNTEDYLRLPRRARFPGHEFSDKVQLSLTLGQGVAGAIPLAGPPMQAAITTLLAILQTIDRRNQNAADLDRLTQRLYGLRCNLDNTPITNVDYLEEHRRDILCRVLKETSAQLEKLRKRSLAYPSVTQAIAGCHSDIDRYMSDCSLSYLMQSRNQLLAIQQAQQEHQNLLMIRQSHVQSFVGLTGTPMTSPVVFESLTLVDATGYEHSIPMMFCASFQQFDNMLRCVLFEGNSTASAARIQKRFITNGQYDLCFDEGTQVARLTSGEWSRIGPGSKIVMRVIIEQQKKLTEVDYKCRVCGAINSLPIEAISYSLLQGAGCSIDCRVCKQRVYVSRRPQTARQSNQSSNIDSNVTTDAEMHLIQNFHVHQTVCRDQTSLALLSSKKNVPPTLSSECVMSCCEVLNRR